MLGWLRLLLDRQQHEATVRRALETIERNARMQSQLIEDLIDVTRIVQGKIRSEFSILDPTSVIESGDQRCAPRGECERNSIRIDAGILSRNRFC